MPSSPNPEGIAQLGLLATLSQAPTVFETFRNPVQAEDIRSCLGKAWDLEAQLKRKANREEAKFSDRQIPQLWILSPTASEDLLRSFAAFPAPENYPPGIYPLASGFKAGIVVIHQLDKIPETLWLRLLGRGSVQKEAIAELKALPDVHPFRGKTLELLYGLLTLLEKRQDLDRSDRELIMDLTTVFLQRLERDVEAATQQAVEQAVEQAVTQATQQATEQTTQRVERMMVESMLQVKFGEIDDRLAQIIDPLMERSPLERTEAIMKLSRQELLDRYWTGKLKIVGKGG
ncbi:hypothetical protein [Roseofilum reptotaenium]|uniref:hypothetical protein n=1 Tax=Roseofilum reptotaenium TaxID=1233427 RepID=UPI000A9F25DC|nr:hypothetical protein [Roseofilum reptotaenium]